MKKKKKTENKINNNKISIFSSDNCKTAFFENGRQLHLSSIPGQEATSENSLAAAWANKRLISDALIKSVHTQSTTFLGLSLIHI